MDTKEILRNQTIDAIKGFTIILVVLGHAIERNFLNNNVSGTIYCLIYTFHMELFMFLCGYLTPQSISKPRYKWLFKKFIRLILPFIVWSIVIYYMRNFEFSDLIIAKADFAFFAEQGLFFFLINCFLYPFISLWFLLVLFIFYVLLVIIQGIEEKTGIIIYLIAYVLIQFIQVRHSYFGPTLVRWHCMFFFGGYLFSRYKNKIPDLSLIYKIIIISIFPILFTIFEYYKLSTAFFPPLPYSISGVDNFMFAKLFIFYNLLAWSGIAATWLIISSIRNANILRPLSFIGLFTLEIYVIHILLLKAGFGEGWLKVLTVTAFGLATSLIVSWLIRRSKILTLIFFGQYDWNSNKLAEI